ncbi:MAG: 2-hydroxyacyl-CoA dehydratase family protein [Thermodesulfobacteriota bacterium]
MTTKVTVPGKKNLNSTLEVSKAIKAYYGNIKEAKKEGKPIVWSVGFTPREIFHALDVPVVFMEHFILFMTAKQLSGKYIQAAEQEGISRDVCAGHRSYLGCTVIEEMDPYIEKLFVPPDLIIASNIPCMSESKSFLYVADHYGCPYYFIDAPINTWGKDIPDYAVEYYKDQLQGALDFMEEHGYKVDIDRLKESVRLSMRLIELWNKIEDCRKSVPTPISAVDGLTAAYPLIQLAGTELGVELYEKLLAELKEKVKRKEGVIEEEKLRLMCFGVPPVYNLGLFNYVEKYGAVVVKSMLEYIGGGVYASSNMDPEKPLESLAYKTLGDIFNPPSGNIADFIKRTISDFNIDGVFGLVKRTCGLLPGYMRPVKDIVYKEFGVPTTIFDLDGIDIREYDDISSKANLDSFVEALLASKGR